MTTETQSPSRQGKAGRPYRADEGATLGGPSPRQRSAILASSNHHSFLIPSAIEFAGADFLEFPLLREMGEGLIGQWPELHFLNGYPIRYLWKADGGKKGGAPVLGKCILASGLVEFFGVATWIVWLAADWAREFEFQEMDGRVCRRCDARAEDSPCQEGEGALGGGLAAPALAASRMLA